MSSKSSLILAIVTVLLLAAAALFQLLEMRSFELFPIVQQRFFGTSEAGPAPASVPASAETPAAPAAAVSEPAAPAAPATPAPGGLFPGKKDK